MRLRSSIVDKASLTPTELIAYTHIAQGETAMQIAERLKIHGYQVRQALQSAYRKVINAYSR